MNPDPAGPAPRASWLRSLPLLAAGLSVLAFVDIIVLERIYKPLADKHAVPWSDFEISFRCLGWPVRMLWWHVAFLPLGLGLFGLIGWAARDRRLALAGMALFATGWEDLAYYVLLLTPPPAELPWLDSNPLVAWPTLLTGAAHVTRIGLLVAALCGGLVATGLLVGARRPRPETAIGAGESPPPPRSN